MNLPRLLFILLILLYLAMGAAQAQKVEVDQEVLNSLEKAAREVVLLRELADAQRAELAAKDRVIALSDAIIEAKDREIAWTQAEADRLRKIKCSTTTVLFIWKRKTCY